MERFMRKIAVAAVAATTACSLFLYGCRSPKEKTPKTYQVEAQIDEFPDSSFFSNIRMMNYVNGNLYVYDEQRGDIVEIDENFERMKTIGRHGEAPDELTNVQSFNLYRDTVYVVDLGGTSIKKYYDGEFVGNFHIPFSHEHRFSIYNSEIFLPTYTDTTTFLRIPLKNVGYQTPMGSAKQEQSQKRTRILNLRHILSDEKGYLFLVSRNYPFIEQYDTNGRYLRTIDLSSIPVVKANIAYAESLPYQENSLYLPLCDCYLKNGYIYLLYSSRNKQGGDYKVKTIIRLSTGEKFDYEIYLLPHNFYSSICVSDTHLFAARDVDDATIEKIRLPDE
jgi:hypothetical protein